MTHPAGDPGRRLAANVLVLRSWAGQRPTMVVGVTRSGAITTTTMTWTPPDAAPSLEPGRPARGGRGQRSVRPAGGGRVRDPSAGPGIRAGPRRRRRRACSPRSTSRRSAASIKPWVGTEPRRASVNVAATGCDNTAFTGKQMSNNLTRSFVIPAAKLPAAFGITETVGTLRAGSRPRLRRRRTPQDRRVSRPRPRARHRGDPAGAPAVEGARPDRVAADDRARRQPLGDLPDGHRPPRAPPSARSASCPNRRRHDGPRTTSSRSWPAPASGCPPCRRPRLRPEGRVRTSRGSPASAGRSRTASCRP